MLSNKELSEKMLYFRGTHGFTQEEFAALSNLSAATINKVEQGKQKPTAKTKVKITKTMEEFDNGVGKNIIKN